MLHSASLSYDKTARAQMQKAGALGPSSRSRRPVPSRLLLGTRARHHAAVLRQLSASARGAESDAYSWSRTASLLRWGGCLKATRGHAK